MAMAVFYAKFVFLLIYLLCHVGVRRCKNDYFYRDMQRKWSFLDSFCINVWGEVYDLYNHSYVCLWAAFVPTSTLSNSHEWE